MSIYDKLQDLIYECGKSSKLQDGSIYSKIEHKPKLVEILEDIVILSHYSGFDDVNIHNISKISVSNSGGVFFAYKMMSSEMYRYFSKEALDDYDKNEINNILFRNMRKEINSLHEQLNETSEKLDMILKKLNNNE